VTTYVADTIALARYFEDVLPRSANRVFGEAERGNATIVLPEIVLAEFSYIALRGRLRSPMAQANVAETVNMILDSPMFRVASLDRQGWNRFFGLAIPELHDRMIVAEALARGAPLITNDEEIGRTEGLKVVWR
jgi:predicted nucleic acid-binding protein